MAQSNYDIKKIIVHYLDRLSKIDVDFLCNDSEWNLSFLSIKRELNRIKSDSKFLLDESALNSEFLLDFANPYLSELEDEASRLSTILNTMRNFIENNRTAYGTNTDNQPLIDTELVMIIKEFNPNYARFSKLIEPILLKLYAQTKKENVDLKIGVEKDISEVYSALFKDRAKTHRIASRWWLALISILSTLSIGYVLCLLNNFNNNTTPFGKDDYLKFFDHVALRVILFSLIAYALHFVSRAYSFNKTQQINNEDKDAALLCFPRFMRTSIKDDPELHRAVMLQITQSIFNSRDNQFSDGSNGDNVAPSTNLGLSLSKSD